MNRTTLRGALLTDWGPVIEITIRSISAVAVACYVAGLMVGTWVHRLNDWLAQHWVGWWVRPESAPPGAAPALLPATAAPIALLMHARVPSAPAVHPLAMLADTLQAQPVAALRRKAGVSSKRHRKGALVAQLVAC